MLVFTSLQHLCPKPRPISRGRPGEEVRPGYIVTLQQNQSISSIERCTLLCNKQPGLGVNYAQTCNTTFSDFELRCTVRAHVTGDEAIQKVVISN